MPPRPKRWTIADPHPAAGELADRLRTSPVLAQVLLNRGLTAADDCSAFLRPALKSLHDPSLIPNLSKAAERIARAIRDKEKIVIYGDYDVDGITATSILWHAIKTLGHTADFYVPHRLEEGYGLNPDSITQLCDLGAQLIITVDCGITAIPSAAIAKSRNVDLIITDHHEWREKSSVFSVQGSGNKGDGSHFSSSPLSSLNPEPLKTEPSLPDCYTIVHPRLPHDGPAYPNPHLCGAGVAFKLAWAIGQAHAGSPKVSEEFKSFLLEATALAALGTIADVVPLIGENRVLAHFGLSGLKSSKLTGIRALIASADLTGKKLDSYHVGFLLAPRLNACGRMGHARLAVELLTRADETQALEIATYLESQNKQRQSLERKILDQALTQAAELSAESDDTSAIVLGAEGWHPGVIGIVASRILERFHKPTLMVGLNNGVGQGSGRSIAGFHLARALESCAEYLETFGGHEMAAGLKLRSDQFEDFRVAFMAHAKSVIRPELLIPELKLDTLAELRHISASLVQDLARMGPFGHGNRKPLLCLRGLQLVTLPRRVGKTGDHLQLQVRQGNTQFKCIAFNHGHHFDRLHPGTTLDLAAEPVINEFNGYTNVELEIKDLHFPSNNP
ncbi:MAG TPA: DHH family phosphoesterase [Tepidisphaeraceae bacterium]|jgi:single-stranded-DNA-specific exonuclease|nr:DHH family phosphoesterase [Tepidisphaeraceae bacterium]